MTKAWKRRAFGLAAVLGVSMHLLLFVAVRPADGTSSADLRVPPKTYYRAAPSDTPQDSEVDVRVVWSPVLFSLPSSLGFSRDLMEEKSNARLTFSQPEESESFLEINPAARTVGTQLSPAMLMLTAGEPAAPSPPSHVLQLKKKRSTARRIYVDPELKERLEGGIVLPPELNRQESTAWEVQADISISRQGIVQHVFLEQPLEAAELNQSVLQLLYGLRFRSGSSSIEGRIEIYSAITTREGGAP